VGWDSPPANVSRATFTFCRSCNHPDRDGLDALPTGRAAAVMGIPYGSVYHHRRYHLGVIANPKPGKPLAPVDPARPATELVRLPGEEYEQWRMRVWRRAERMVHPPEIEEQD
jgi:hypothetical protein